MASVPFGSCPPSDARCSASWLHTVNWIKNCNQKVPETYALYSGITTEFCTCNRSFCVCQLWDRNLSGKLHYSLSDNTAMCYLPEFMCLRWATCPSYSLFLRWRIWVWPLNWIQRKIQLLTCTLLQSNSPTMGHVVLDLTSLAYQPKSRERSARPTKLVTFCSIETNQYIQLASKNWMTTKMINLLFVQIVMPILKRKMKMLNLWCNLHPVKKELKMWIFCKTQCSYIVTKKKKDLQFDEIHLSHWNKMYQEPPVSSQKTSRVRGKNSNMKFFRSFCKSCRIFVTWRIFTSKITTYLVHSLEESNSLGHFWKRFMTFIIMRRRPAQSAIRLSQEDHALADWEQKKLEISSTKIGGQIFGFLIVLDGASH